MKKLINRSVLAVLFGVLLVAGSSSAKDVSLTDKVRHELNMLPYYGVFDAIAYEVNGDAVNDVRSRPPGRFTLTGRRRAGSPAPRRARGAARLYAAPRGEMLSSCEQAGSPPPVHSSPRTRSESH